MHWHKPKTDLKEVQSGGTKAVDTVSLTWDLRCFFMSKLPKLSQLTNFHS